MKELQLAPQHLPTTGSIESYVARVNVFPVLSKEEEAELATRLQKEGDLQAAQTLVLSQLRYVVRIAKGYMGYGLGFADLVQEGTIGLMKAVKRFDPDKGVRLVSFAVHWIKSEIHDYVIKNWRIVKVATTKAQRKLFFNLRRNKQRLGWFTQEELEAVAKDLNVPVKQVMEMELRLAAGGDVSFDRPETDDDSDERMHAPEQYLEIEHADPLMLVSEQATSDSLQEKLREGLDLLDSRSRDIIEKRWLNDEKSTLKDLANEYQVSIERVRQIEQTAFEKLKNAVHEAY